MTEQNVDWEGKWIWSEGLPRTVTPGRHELVLFRRTFSLPDTADAQEWKLTIRVSADSRYRLYMNGQSVSVGPCKGDRHTHYYETVNLTAYLRRGVNVLAAKVLHYAASDPFQPGIGGPISVWRSNAGGFFMDGALLDEQDDVAQELHTDSQWRCLPVPGYVVEPSWIVTWLGGVERLDGTTVPREWIDPAFDDSDWLSAVPFCDTRNDWGELTGWKLTTRTIPPLYEQDSRFVGMTRSQGVSGEQAESVLQGSGVMRVQPGDRIWLEVDAGELTTGYLQVAVSGGAGSEVRLLSAECYEEADSSMHMRKKGIRDQHTNDAKLIGDYDIYTVAGYGSYDVNNRELYEPFWFRTFRYVRLEVTAADEPLLLHGFQFRETGYPLEVQSDFACSDERWNKLWQLSLNTLRRCMHETYEDCPYYEQLQYTMDTRLQMLFTYHLTTDDRLARKAIFDYHSSQLPNGMLQCRYPSVYPQVIPSFSFYWIGMLEDHYRYFGDTELLRRYRPTMAAVLDFFERRLTSDGLVGMMPSEYWNYFDWVEDWENGAPPCSTDEPVAMLSLMYSAALRSAARLYEATDWTDAAMDCRRKSQSLNTAVRKLCWSPERELFRDGPSAERYCQHTQIWAMMAEAVTGEGANELMNKTLSDHSLDQVSLPMAHFLFRTLDRMGWYDRSSELWNRWLGFLDLHLTTLPEIGHGSPRSDCHAWSAQPLAEFPMSVLGIQPAEPGFAAVIVAPKPLHLHHAKGTLMTVRGQISVAWHIEENQFFLSVSAPPGIPVTVELPDGSRTEVAECRSYTTSCLMKTSQG